MTNRDDVEMQLSNALLNNGVRSLRPDSLEHTEQFEVFYPAGNGTIRATVTKYPEGANPESYNGSERWAIVFYDEDGDTIGKIQNPEPTLADAIALIDWDALRSASGA